MVDRIRIGIIGAGGIVQWAHLPSLKLLRDRVDVRVVFSRSIERAKEVAMRFSIPEATDDWRSTVSRGDLDALLIATPNYTHKTIAVESVRAGKHVFLEKPVALSIGDGLEIVREAEKAGVNLMVGHCLRFWPEYVRVRESILSNAIGEPRVARAYRLSSFPRWAPWHRYRELSGGVVVDLMIHDLDFLRWILGEVEEVFGYMVRFTEASIDNTDHAVAILRFRDGAIAYVEASWAFPSNFPFTTYLEIAGTKGLLTVDNRSTATVEVFMESVQNVLAPVDKGAYFSELKAFIDWIQYGVKPPIEPMDAVEALRIAVAVHRSSEMGAPIKVSEVM
ncbi:MAG: Gfo/Idh/MocA family oxidoreductase [Ignisphaera sp.]